MATLSELTVQVLTASKRKICICGLFMLILVTSGCSGSRGTMSFRGDKPLTSETTAKPEDYYVLKNYMPGVERSVYIGQSMLRVSDYKATTELLTEKSIRFKPSRDHILSIKYMNKFNTEAIISVTMRNNEYPIDFSTNINGRKYYIVSVVDSNNEKWGLLVNDKYELDNKYIADEDWDHYYRVISMTTSVDNIKYIDVIDNKTTDLTKIVPADLNYELIYSGLNKIAINIAYREFTRDNVARAAFYQNISYEPGSKQIRFRDTVIAINEITNEQIKFTVISDGLPASPSDDIIKKLTKNSGLSN